LVREAIEGVRSDASFYQNVHCFQLDKGEFSVLTVIGKQALTAGTLIAFSGESYQGYGLDVMIFRKYPPRWGGGKPCPWKG
jgi:hypothetical protein